MKKIIMILSLALLAPSLSAADMGTHYTTRCQTDEEEMLGYELIDAIEEGNEERVAEILAQDRNACVVNVHGFLGQTPLIIATREGSVAMVNRLLAAGADIKGKDKFGNTALMGAAYKKHREIVERLLIGGADIDAHDQNDWTALMIASENGQVEIVRDLLDAGADKTLQNNENDDALKIARYNGHSAIVDLIENHVLIEPEEETLMVKPAVSE